tara:strand:+ start:529 stop:1518 length:990 start_codon:yes stop_codon:yes gene_type:complete
MSNYGYIGEIPDQTQENNTGVFNTNDINNLSQETPAKWRQEFIVMDFFACAGGGGGGGGSFQHGSGSTLGGGGGGGEATLQENNNTYFKLGTTYAITIGAGGAKGDGTSSSGGNGNQGGDGGNTTVANETGTLTLLGGGGGGRTTGFTTGAAGSSGGSGGGGGGGGSSGGSGGASTASAGVGNAGGPGYVKGGGVGGGASAAGLANNTSNTRPNGYFHLESLNGGGQPPARNGFYIDWVLAENSTRGSTLARGGGTSSTVNDAIANTGTGGMGKYEQGTGMNGGSGIVVFRYPKELTITASSATVATATVGIYKITEVTASSGGTVRWD